MDDAEDALESSNLDVVQDAYDALYSAAQLLGEAIYQGAKSQTDGGDLGDLDDDELLEDFNLSEDTFDSEYYLSKPDKNRDKILR